MADFELVKIASYGGATGYELYTGSVSDVDGDFQHTFRLADDVPPRAIVHMGFHVESMAGMPTVLEQTALFTCRRDDSMYKLWRRQTNPFTKVLVSAIYADIELQYPVELRRGENILVQTKETDTGGTPTGDVTVLFTCRPTWEELTADLRNQKFYPR